MIAFSTLKTVVRRLRFVTWRQIFRALIPTKVDLFVARGDRQTLATTPPVTTSLPVVIDRYDACRKSGIPDVDGWLRGSTVAYLARVESVIAHRAFLAFDCPRLLQFGFDPKAPMVFEVFTAPAYRGKHLQALVQRHILEDVLARHISDKVYAEIGLHNIASIKGIQRGGAPRIARIQGIKFAGFVFRRRVLPVSSANTGGEADLATVQ